MQEIFSFFQVSSESALAAKLVTSELLTETDLPSCTQGGSATPTLNPHAQLGFS